MMVDADGKLESHVHGFQTNGRRKAEARNVNARFWKLCTSRPRRIAPSFPKLVLPELAGDKYACHNVKNKCSKY